MNSRSILEAIGNTPLVKINLKENRQIYAKLEYLNPGGSVKARPAKYLIEESERQELLQPGETIIEAFAGNQSMAVAMIGRAKGYNVIITVSENINIEKRNALKAYGATVITCPETDSLQDSRSYYSEAIRIHKQTSKSFMSNQYFTKANRLVHEKTTGPEIWQQTKGKITHFFAAAGTGGMISGIGRYLKSKNRRIKIIAAEVNHFYQNNNSLYQIDEMGMNFNSPALDYSIIDDIIEISNEQALESLGELAHNHGILVGPSSGAVTHMTKLYAEKMRPDDLGVMIFADSGHAHLSKELYNTAVIY